MTDERLILETGNGSVAAFDQLYERYQHRAFRLACSVCGDRGRAEDAVQEAFLAIWRSSASYSSRRGTVAAWVLAIVRHRAIDIGRRNLVDSERRSGDLPEFAHPISDTTGEAIMRREQREQLQLLLSLLPDAQHEVITLAFYGQLTHTEIAEHLGLPAGTVKGRMRLGMDKLRVSLAQTDDRLAVEDAVRE